MNGAAIEHQFAALWMNAHHRAHDSHRHIVDCTGATAQLHQIVEHKIPRAQFIHPGEVIQHAAAGVSPTDSFRPRKPACTRLARAWSIRVTVSAYVAWIASTPRAA